MIPALAIPDSFAAGVIAERGEPGAAWLESLPALISRYCRRWQLKIAGGVMHGYLGLVIPVEREGGEAVLKVTWVDEETRGEALALRLWNGDGAVLLLASEETEGVLLLERLDGSRSLDDLDLPAAVEIASSLLRRMAVRAPASSGLPHMAEYARRKAEELWDLWDSYARPFDERWLLAARRAARRLSEGCGDLLVNQDLHYENVLAGRREPWLVIDPKPVVGDTEFSIAPLLWNRLARSAGPGEIAWRFERIVEVAGLARRRGLDWTLLRCVDYWLWSLSVGHSEDPERCRALIRWLVE